jgi:hypothetical protein
MSQRDLVDRLREHRPVAPAELRQSVRLIAAEATRPRRRLWRGYVARRALAAAFAVAATALLAGVFLSRDESGPTRFSGGAPSAASRESLHNVSPGDAAVDQSATAAPPPLASAGATAGGSSALKSAIVPPPGTNAQRYSATLSLRLKDSAAVSEATNRALKIVAAMGGHPNTVNVDAERKDGEAYLVLKVPRARVQEAVQKLGALGTIIGADVSIKDLQAGIDTTGRTIDRLQEKLAELRAEVQTEDVVAQVETLETRIENLQRQRAATIRAAHFATVKLHMKTPPPATPPAEESGTAPLHGLGVAFRWIGIGAVYALALGTPLVLLVALGWFLARGLRRRREEALLGRA